MFFSRRESRRLRDDDLCYTALWFRRLDQVLFLWCKSYRQPLVSRIHINDSLIVDIRSAFSIIWWKVVTVHYNCRLINEHHVLNYRYYLLAKAFSAWKKTTPCLATKKQVCLFTIRIQYYNIYLSIHLKMYAFVNTRKTLIWMIGWDLCTSDNLFKNIVSLNLQLLTPN